MDNTAINLDNVLGQAPHWTFAGDFTLLQWMNKISKDLEIRANKSTDALTKLNNNVRTINIGLDNVANSLTTLQFGNQFVECRVQDDDETLANANEATATSEGRDEIEETPTSQEMLKTFLDNNLKILRNCHEKYSLDLDDSDDDDDEGPKEKTCIYQPINPYNERPLPFIFGTKDWHAKWHVGLYENQQDSNYSGDEISETFSESSTNSPTDEQESFESNTEWVSSNSIDNDNYNANIEVRNASSLRGSQALYPGTPNIPIKVSNTHTAITESSSMSTPSSSLAKNSIQTKKRSEINTSRSASVSSLNSKAVPATQVITKGKSLIYRTPAPPFVDLFAEPPEDIESNASSSTSSNQKTKRPSVDYTTALPKQIQSTVKEIPSILKTQSSPYVDLFAEPPEDIPSTTSSSISSTQNFKRKIVNLFDDDNDEIKDYLFPAQTKKHDIEIPKSSKENFMKGKEFYENDLPQVHTKKDDFVKSKSTRETSVKTQPFPKTPVSDKPLNVSITPKSLFDDDDDENDDFLEAFVKKSSTKESLSTSLTKTLLFDNDLVTETSKNQSQQDVMEEQKYFLITSKTKKPKTNKINIFDDLEDDYDNLLFNISNKNKVSIKTVDQKSNAEKKLQDTVTTRNEKEFKVDEKKTTNKNSVKLFDDLEEDYVKDNPKQNTEIENVKVDSSTAKAIKKINLFDDLEDEDDDFFALKSKEIPNKISDSHQNKSILEPTNINKDKTSSVKENSLEHFIKPKDDGEYTKSFNKEYILQKDSTDFNKTKENKSFKEVSLEQETNEQILSEEIIKPIEKSTEPSKNVSKLATVIENSISHSIANETNPILTQQVQTNSNIATKEQEIKDTRNLLTKNDQSTILNEDNATKSIREKEISEHAESPKVVAATKPLKESVTARESENLTTTSHIDSSSSKMSSDFHKISENLTTKTLQQNNETPAYRTDEKLVVSDTKILCTPKDIESSSSTTKYDFSSVLFLDEPPEDDSDFFETLAKSPLALNTKYNSIDLENELYEPELPKVPVTNSNTIPTDILDNRHTSLYTGLQLFSDIPPDDDDDDESDDIQRSPKRSTQTKRLHSVFYDDFNETLMALNQNQQQLQSPHTIFQNEPPPLKEQPKSSTLNINKDVVDHKLSHTKPEIYSKSSEVKLEERSEIVLLKSDTKSPEASKKRPISKLQIPNININVQALLPGALRKDKEDSKRISEKKPETDSIIQKQTTKTNVVEKDKKEIIAPKRDPVIVPLTEETEHILNSITKTRVRAPATRRPSTRRARQDNYRKSLLEEEQQVIETLPETQNYNINKKEETQIKKCSSNVKESKEEPTFDLEKKHTFGHDNYNDGKDIFKKIKGQTMLAKEIQKKTLTKEQNVQKGDEKSKTSLLFYDDKSEVEEKYRSNREEQSAKDSGKVLVEREGKTPASSLIPDGVDNSDILKNIKPSKTKNIEESKTEDSPSYDTKTKVASKSSLQKVNKKLSPSLLFDDTEDEDNMDFFKYIKSSKTKDSTGEVQNKSQIKKETKIENNSLNQSQLKMASAKLTNSSQFSEKEKEDHSLDPTKIVTHTLAPTISEVTSSFTPNLKEMEKKQEQVPKLESNKDPTGFSKSSAGFIDDDNDGNLFGITNIVNAQQHIQSSANLTLTKPEISKEIPTESLKNSKPFTFLDNENYNDNTQQTHPTNTFKTIESIRTKENNQKAKAQFKSFLDNESDNDEDFTEAILQATKSTQSKKPPTLPATANTSKTSTQKTSSNKNTATILFTDSDTDSEDLFAKISSTQSLNKPTNKTKDIKKNQKHSKVLNPQSSLFSDDSDSDDFIKTSESVSKDVIFKSSTRENKSKVPQSNASLFSDIDSDEDDLFGSGASKSTKASTVKASVNTQSVATTTQTSKAKTIADNPLADLL